MSHLNEDTPSRAGLLAGITAAVIWGGWPIVTALGVGGHFPPLYITLIRFSIAGLILLPFAFRTRLSAKDWSQALALTMVAGAGYTLTTAEGLVFAPASHAGLIIPSTVMIVGLVAGHFVLGDRLSWHRIAGALLILAGIATLAGSSLGDGKSFIGDLLFMAGGILWGTFTVLMKRWRLNALTATARVSVLSGLLLLPVTVSHWSTIMALPVGELLLQGVWQGVMSSVVAVILFGHAIATLGAGRASVLNTATPGVTLLLAILVLGAEPGLPEWLGLALIVSGMGTALKISVRPLARRGWKTLARAGKALSDALLKPDYSWTIHK